MKVSGLKSHADGENRYTAERLYKGNKGFLDCLDNKLIFR